MSRTKWKGFLLDKKKTENLKLMSRNAEIVPRFLGLTFKVYNGKKYLNFTITKEMIGHKFGEFSATRGTFSFKKKRSKK